MVEETVGVTEISGKYHSPALEVLPSRGKNRPLSKVATNGVPTLNAIKRYDSTGHKVKLLVLLLLLLLLLLSSANGQTALHE